MSEVPLYTFVNFGGAGVPTSNLPVHLTDYSQVDVAGLRYKSVNVEGYHESERCSRDTYPESYITKYSSIRRQRPLSASRESSGERFGRVGHHQPCMVAHRVPWNIFDYSRRKGLRTSNSSMPRKGELVVDLRPSTWHSSQFKNNYFAEM